MDDWEKKEKLIEFEMWSSEKECLEAVKNDGYALQYVKVKVTFVKILETL